MIDYRLLDFGDGRKLEAFSGYVVDRPSPAAQGYRRHSPAAWQTAAAQYLTDGWVFHQPFPADLQLPCRTFVMPLAPRPFGHIGVFPEQADNWLWLNQQVHELQNELVGSRAVCGINLFAYTGASTLAMASAGAAVAHVDAAKPNVQAAKEAAEASQLSGASIRYLVDDAAEFAAREVRRNRRYDVFVLDPPAYGHSPKGQAWRLERDLWSLLADLLNLATAQSRWLVTGHSEQVQAMDVLSWFRQHTTVAHAEYGDMDLMDEAGRALNAGWYLRLWA